MTRMSHFGWELLFQKYWRLETVAMVEVNRAVSYGVSDTRASIVMPKYDVMCSWFIKFGAI